MAKKWKKGNRRVDSGWSNFYFLGMVGAAVWYLHTSYGFGSSIVALLKAVVWPAFLVFHLLAG